MLKGHKRPAGKLRETVCAICQSTFWTTHNHQKICTNPVCIAETERRYSRAYYSRNRSTHKDRIKKNHERWPEKYAARSAVQRALESGAIVKKPCKNCGTTERVHAHHHDYSKPLDVEWMCAPCHWAEHHQAEAA